MKFSQYGYTEKKIKTREMSMGAIILTASQALIKADKMDMEIRIVDCSAGIIERWDGIKGIMKHDWAADYRVNVYDMCVVHNNKENVDYLKIIISDDAEE